MIAHNSNGKVERSQRTDLEKFWATIDLNDANFNLTVLLGEWQNYYNHEHPQQLSPTGIIGAINQHLICT